MTMARLKKVLEWIGKFVFYGALIFLACLFCFGILYLLYRLFLQNDMTKGVMMLLIAVIIGFGLAWGEAKDCKTNRVKHIIKNFVIWIPFMLFLSLVLCIDNRDVYGGSTTLFDKVKRNVYWITPNFEIPYHATLIADGAFADCDMLKSVEISNRVKTIGVKAFANCARLEKVVIGNGVTSIGNSAFYSCESLKDVKMGNAVISINGGAFENCRSLESVTIPSYVASIGDRAFYNCISLTTIYCKTVTPPKLEGNSVFACCIGGTDRLLDCIIYVPKESVRAYQTADVWKFYADRIVGYDF